MRFDLGQFEVSERPESVCLRCIKGPPDHHTYIVLTEMESFLDGCTEFDDKRR